MKAEMTEQDTDSKQPRTLVAGGSSGIGHALINLLLKSRHKVYNLDIKPTTLDSPDYVGKVVDLRDYQETQAIVRQIGLEVGYITGLAAVAGLAYRTPIESLSVDEFRSQIESNLDIIYNLCQAVYPYLNNEASIVTVSSVSVYGSSEGASIGYAAAKAGIIGLTKNMAMQAAKRGIRVNCIVPGAVNTPLLNSVSTPTERRLLQSAIPLGRLAAPQEIAEIIKFLLEDRSGYITGQVIAVDGGLSLAYRPFLY
jgi:3-oxoacyl-[acyl-carrier protein] reductase